MQKNSKQLSEEIEKLKTENKELRQQLLAATESIDAIKEGNIDALVVPDSEYLKIYTEKSADKIYRILIEQMNESAVTLSRDCTILYCNSRFATLVQLPLQKVIGAKFYNFIDDTSAELFEILFIQSWKTHLQDEVNVRSGNGDVIPVMVSVNTLSWENNSVLSIILTDITIQNKYRDELIHRTRQLEQKNVELEKTNKELETFTYVASHDLQEPLRKIKNYAASLLNEEQTKLSDNSKDYLQRLQETAKRMQRLIEDLLAYARIRNAGSTFEMTDLNTVVEEVTADFKEILNEKKGVIISGGLCNVCIIPFQFRQLLSNLISNSLKFSDPQRPPRITIESTTAPGSTFKNEALSPGVDYCHITFTDNGIGFDPQYKDRIFEVFQRLNEYSDYKGTGIGLAICKRIVENHSGFITATGQLNKGVRFDIFIPAAL